MREFTTPTRDNAPVTEFTLDGRVFRFTAPKASIVLLGLVGGTNEQITAVLDWLGAGLSDEDGQHILDRLRDPDDDLDVDTLTEVIQYLAGSIAARPTQP